MYRLFKGSASEYRALHDWVIKLLGKPLECWCCGSYGVEKQRYYQWANVSGEYQKDLQDWVRLCAPCHFEFDGKSFGRTGDELLRGRYCPNGHDLSANLFFKKSGIRKPIRACRECYRNYLRNFRLKKKLS